VDQDSFQVIIGTQHLSLVVAIHGLDLLPQALQGAVHVIHILGQ